MKDINFQYAINKITFLSPTATPLVLISKRARLIIATKILCPLAIATFIIILGTEVSA